MLQKIWFSLKYQLLQNFHSCHHLGAFQEFSKVSMNHSAHQISQVPGITKVGNKTKEDEEVQGGKVCNDTGERRKGSTSADPGVFRKGTKDTVFEVLVEPTFWFRRRSNLSFWKIFWHQEMDQQQKRERGYSLNHHFFAANPSFARWHLHLESPELWGWLPSGP